MIDIKTVFWNRTKLNVILLNDVFLGVSKFNVAWFELPNAYF